MVLLTESRCYCWSFRVFCKNLRAKIFIKILVKMYRYIYHTIILPFFSFSHFLLSELFIYINIKLITSHAFKSPWPIFSFGQLQSMYNKPALLFWVRRSLQYLHLFLLPFKCIQNDCVWFPVHPPTTSLLLIY